ncbi:MAG: GntR family transcriptional regulator [Candidatus Firestonebacteria bacterium]|nr:GntR family transcriptional regulator [Candidatus Firestonebacteria bacterium]
MKLSQSSSIPIYIQITQNIKYDIVSGKLKPRDKLPSVRELSLALTINPNTVAKAYTELEHEKAIVGKPGQGYFVTEEALSISRMEKESQISKLIEKAVVEALRMGLKKHDITKLAERKIEEILKQKHMNG